MAVAAKRPRTLIQSYQMTWREEYFVVRSADTCCCLVCAHIFGNNRTKMVKNHFLKLHPNYDVDYPKGTTARTRQIEALEKKLLNEKQQSESSTIVNNDPKSITKLSFKVAFILAKAMKPLDDGLLAKDLMIETANVLIHDAEIKNKLVAKIKDIPLSKSAVTKKVQLIANDIHGQFIKDVQNCDWFSLQADDSTDNADAAQLNIFIRMVSDNFHVIEEFFFTIQFKDGTSEKNIFSAITDELSNKYVPLQKLVSLTTDDGDYLRTPDGEFRKQVHDSAKVAEIKQYFSSPLIQATDTCTVSTTLSDMFPALNDAQLKEEIAALHGDDVHRQTFSRVSPGEFWAMVDREKYFSLAGAYKRLLSCFGSNHLCETMFSSTKHANSKLRSRISNENSEDLLRISASSYEPNFDNLVKDSHRSSSPH